MFIVEYVSKNDNMLEWAHRNMEPTIKEMDNAEISNIVNGSFMVTIGKPEQRDETYVLNAYKLVCDLDDGCSSSTMPIIVKVKEG